MKLENLLHRLKAEAYAKADLQWKQDRIDLVKRRTAKQPTVTQSCLQQVRNLRAKSEDIYEEIYQRKLLQIAQEQFTRANVALLEANRTPAERAARDEEIREFQERFAALVPEASNSWRTQENPFAEHYRQQRYAQSTNEIVKKS
jgi:hypothetical protein